MIMHHVNWKLELNWINKLMISLIEPQSHGVFFSIRDQIKHSVLMYMLFSVVAQRKFKGHGISTRIGSLIEISMINDKKMSFRKIHKSKLALSVYSSKIVYFIKVYGYSFKSQEENIGHFSQRCFYHSIGENYLGWNYFATFYWQRLMKQGVIHGSQVNYAKVEAPVGLAGKERCYQIEYSIQVGKQFITKSAVDEMGSKIDDCSVKQ